MIALGLFGFIYEAGVETARQQADFLKVHPPFSVSPSKQYVTISSTWSTIYWNVSSPDTRKGDLIMVFYPAVENVTVRGQLVTLNPGLNTVGVQAMFAGRYPVYLGFTPVWSPSP